MKFVTYLDGSKERVGVLSPDGTTLYPVTELGLKADDMIGVIKELDADTKKQLAERLSAPGVTGVPYDKAQLLAPIPMPRDVIVVSQNYATHVQETCRMNGVEYKKPEYCSYLTRRVNRAVAPGGKVLLHPSISSGMDYEVELAVVIGKECRRVSAENAFDYIFGYTVANDFTARDLQKNLAQYGYAKGLDDTSPFGPCIVTGDEITDPHNLQLTLKVNGELRQNGNTNDFIFNIPALISDLAKGMTLFPGDIIITGTPSGIGGAKRPPVYLKRGDVVEAAVEGIGVLRNVMEEADTL